MRAQFVFSEIWIGLRRNLTMTIAVVVIVFVSLALLGAGLLAGKQVETMKDYWYDKVEVSIFLCGEGSDAPSCANGSVTQTQRDTIRADLTSLPQVDTVFYESQADAFVRFKEQFRDSAIADNITEDAMPESYRVKLKDPQQYNIVASAFGGRPGIEQVQDQRRLLDRFFKVLHGIQVVMLVIAGVLVAAAILLISITIRLAAFSRRRETGIMRLVGASNFYIQLPFLLEAALAGLVGAALASGAVVLIKSLLIDGYLKPSFQFTNFVGWGEVLATIPILLIVGVALAALASFVTLRKYLRV